MVNTVPERPTFTSPPRGADPSLAIFGSDLIRTLTGLFTSVNMRVNRTLPKDGTEPMTAPLELMTYTDTPDTKPAAAAANAGSIIYVSDGGAGAKFRGSDGTSWVNLG
jgi:hypothetical protein